MRVRIGVATCDWLPELDPDDHLLLQALRARGLDPQPAVWSDPGVDWPAFDLVLIRSVWDYFHRHAEFLAWIERVRHAAPVWNPPDVLAWNSEKGYLRELEQRGVPVVPTAWVRRGATVDMAALLGERGWDDAIAKPTVAGGSLGLMRLARDTPGDDHVRGLVESGDAMVQPFIRSVVEEGELSVVCIDGAPSHAVRKVPAAGDIRVQPEHGGVVTAAEIDAEARAAVERVLAAVDSDLLYARVDLVRDDSGRLVLIELEAIEPRLFLGHAGGAAECVAAAVAARL